MTQDTLQLRHLALLGPAKKPAVLEFSSGLNVICGASDTGKSFLVEAIDFLLGGGEPLRDIPERVGYDQGRIGISTSKDGEYTLSRGVGGGEFAKYHGLFPTGEPESKSEILGAKHTNGKEDNLSGFLLARINLLSKSIRKNGEGELRGLSFRDLARFVIVQEEEIIKKGSPFLSTSVYTRTASYSTLKLMLTGVDDSSVVSPVTQTQSAGHIHAKIELLDQLIAEVTAEIQAGAITHQDVASQLGRLEQVISDENSRLVGMQAQVDDAVKMRNEIIEKRSLIASRITEIQELLERFGLLERHYQVDLERLVSIQESGSLFVHFATVACPLCGAAPEHQGKSSDCEGDVTSIVKAASAEIAQINLLSEELKQTVGELKIESVELTHKLSSLERDYRELSQKISRSISPELGATRAAYSELVNKRSEVKANLELFERLNRLELQKRQLVEEASRLVAAKSTKVDLSKIVLDAFAKEVERILSAWHFPGSQRVYFDEKTLDFVIDGKPRGSRGKGLRAITHAAVSIALLEFCRDRSLPHPGFVVLDSPLLAYFEPEGVDDDLSGTDLKDKFYEYLAENAKASQVIIVENQHPPVALSDEIALTVFTKNPALGRYGFLVTD